MAVAKSSTIGSAPQIVTKIPGDKAKKIIERDHKVLATSTKTLPVAVKRGKGSFIEDVDGNIFIDFTCGVGVTNLGHCHDELIKRVKEQLDILWHFAGTDFYYELQVTLAEKLTKIMPGKFEKKVFFTNSGTESNEAALKLARQATDRKEFIAFLGAFHGRSFGSLSLTASKVVHKEKYFPFMPGVLHIPYAYCYRCPYKLEYPACDFWCVKILEEIYFQNLLPPDDVAALFVEPIQGEGGYIVPPIDYYAQLRKIADKYGFLLIDDEVQAGFGRTGKMFAVEHYNIEPDVISCAKGMGSGLPIGAIIFNSKYDFKKEGSHSNTYGGNLITCVSSIATIEIIEKENLLNRAQKLGEVVKKYLNEMKDKYSIIGDVRGLGLMWGIELVKNRKTKEYANEAAKKVQELCFKNGLILLTCGRSTIRLLPALTIEENILISGLNILENAIKKVET